MVHSSFRYVFNISVSNLAHDWYSPTLYFPYVYPSMIVLYRLVFVICFLVGGPLFVGGVEVVETQPSQTCCICFELLSEEGSTPPVVVNTPYKFLNSLRGVSSVSGPNFNCCHADLFHKTCVEAWVDRGRPDCPICREEFGWNLGSWIKFLESNSSREVFHYYMNFIVIGMVAYIAFHLLL